MTIDIIIENESLIYSIINKYSYYFDKEDLYQVAVIGLINAYKNYQENKSTKFSSYAYFYITGEVKKYIRDSNLFKVSKELIKLNVAIEKAKGVLSQKLLREPTDLEISFFLEVPEEKVLSAKMANTFVTSLDELNEEDDCLYDIVGLEETFSNPEILDLKQELDNLDDFSKTLIKERYINEKTQSETSSVLGITQVQTSRKEKEILQRLKTRLM